MVNTPETTPFSPSPGLARTLIFLLILLAFGVRFVHILNPPLDFHTPRQLHSVILTRGIYLHFLPPEKSREKETDIINAKAEIHLEPPIVETLTACMFRLTGGEHLAIPRFLSTLFFLFGGLFLFGIARRFLNEWGAIFSLATYFFLPYAVLASTSFQPDPLMLMAILASLYWTTAYDNRSSATKLAAAILSTAFAIFVKPFALFFTLPLLIFVLVRKKKVPALIAALVISALPAAIYLAVTWHGGLQQQAHTAFIPSLLLKPWFYMHLGWMILSVTGFALIPMAAAGFLLIHNEALKRWVAVYTAGYLLFILIFAYHTATHDYYHLPIIIPLSLLSGAFGSLILQAFPARRRALLLLSAAILLFSLPIAVLQPRLCVRTDSNILIKRAQEVGEITGHTQKALFLTPCYGKVMKVYGGMGGWSWPNSFDMKVEDLAGKKRESLTQRLDRVIQERHPAYFIITGNELARKGNLVRLLSRAFEVTARTEGYLVVNLEKSSIRRLRRSSDARPRR